MKKDFYKDFILNSDIYCADLKSAKILEYHYQNNYLIFKIMADVQLKSTIEDKRKNFELLIEQPLEQMPFENLNLELSSIKCMLVNKRLTIYGEIELSGQIREEKEMRIDPFKEKLINSFVKLKRNFEDVDVISTIEEENNQISTTEEESNKNKISTVEEEVIDPIEIVPVQLSCINNEKKEDYIKDSFVSSFFYYKMKKDEKITDVINKFNLTMDEILKYNNQKEYKENTLIKIKKQ